MKVKVIISASFLLFSLNSQAYSKEVTKPSATTKSTLKAGNSVDGKFVSSFEPPPKVGLRYTFFSSAKGGNYNIPPKDETTEVISINNGYATLRVSGTFKEDTDKVVKLSDIRSSGVMYVTFRYDGLFDVNVPFKNFKKATKVSVSNNNTDLSIWLVKGIGVVKLVEFDKNSKTTITTELKNFKSGGINIDNKFY